jgi:excinuclease ABC subunit C
MNYGSNAKKDLRLHVEPRHIECFDNLIFKDLNPAAACVVLKMENQKDYRHFNIKQSKVLDDFASMEEVVYQPLQTPLDEKRTTPI